MANRFSTAAIASGDRAEYWQQALRDAFRADCMVEPTGKTGFEAEMAVDRIGDIGLVDIRGAAYEISRQGNADPARAFALLQIEGNCVVRDGCGEAVLKPGDFCVLPDGREMSIERPNRFRHVSIALPAAALKEICPQFQQHCTQPISTANGSGAVLAATLKSVLAERDSIEPACEKQIGELILGLCSAVLNASAATRDPVEISDPGISRLAAFHKQSIFRFACANLRNPALNIEFIASGVGLSPRYIHRLFSGEKHSLMEMVWIQRLDNAAKDLANPSLAGKAICSIAYSWGFNDQAHFSRSFRKRFGTTPREYRG